jgi:hypothetical protein
MSVLVASGFTTENPVGGVRQDDLSSLQQIGKLLRETCLLVFDV